MKVNPDKFQAISFGKRGNGVTLADPEGGLRGLQPPPPLIFKKEVTSVAVVISTVSTVSEQERNGTGRTGVTLGSQSMSVRPSCS